MPLSTWMPYECAWEVLADLLWVQVSKATARRVTLHIGEAALAVWDVEGEQIKQESPELPAGPGEGENQSLSADGAMVYQLGGEWAEVKTLALGEVTRNGRSLASPLAGTIHRLKHLVGRPLS